MFNNNLSDRALLLSPVIHTFYNTRSDSRMLSEAMTTVRGLTTDDAIMRSLLPVEAFKGINAAKQKVRKTITDHTFLWSEAGRILPAADVFKFHEVLNKVLAEFNEEADALADVYPALVAQMRQLRGDWFNELEYPATKEAFRERFHVELNFTPFPDVEDFRLQVPDEMLDQIRSSITEGFQKNLNLLRAQWLDDMHEAATSFVEVPTSRRWMRLRNNVTRLLPHAKLMLPAEDVIIGVAEHILSLPQNHELALKEI